MESSQKEIRQFNNDELFLIAIQLDLSDLLRFCQTNKQSRKLCNTDPIWNYRLNKDFSDYSETFIDLGKIEKYKLLYALRIIKKGFKSNRNLTEFYNSTDLALEYMNIEKIPEKISQLKNLKILFLVHNEIKQIPKEIGQLKNLEILNLRDNKIKEIPKEIGQLNNLKILDLSYNKIEKIPKEIAQLKNLEKLYLHYKRNT